MGEAKAGRYEKDDCQVTICRSEGQSDSSIRLESSVEKLYGNQIRSVAEETLGKLGISEVTVDIKDRGAMDWVLMARIEAAAKRLFSDLKQEALPAMEKTPPPSSKERLRRSRLYLPGNNPTLMLNAGLFQADGIILDLEDSVHPAEKDAALILVRNALRAIDFSPSERMVRINPLPDGLDEIAHLLPHGLDMVLIPKAEAAEDTGQAGSFIDSLSPGRPLFLMPIIESARGLMNAYPIALSSPRVAALTFGAEDFTRDIGAERTREGRESFFARSQVVAAARAAGIQPIDTVYSDVEDDEGLTNAVLEARSLGFDGKGCIHPRQISIIHEACRPAEDEIRNALKVRRAMKEAEEKGLGVISIGSKMIDPPIVARAMKVLSMAELYNIDLRSYEEEN